ncbi:CCHC-type zinc finger transcription factor [Phycomyces blakesleeanus NRRL 1555(-)]|uniref:CCHC-type zinc finger transcription factor n=1 Tax=Phycomyces blakesleeanus (strain ATCC 8743b / DSM 1359 / FGSC 10004 / NBRC 33097 / NRRL 1555) TaxID=763407 RepID=A0A167JTH7_PHYB8|nr:CCHC-type zinc finger transcription factor [Phycomyces blakesleeanus NRRL 1555(-)]OAD66677.1 CCHC-type zinc finger transcription factor [Phycomyces blakesleeanus NRRL 1555(-)]|eukprot:XP_018284717.1 CCHC-type zinc finger transcription factor [Phycomyces blakesleeanus NRRL 1555(-)]
MALSTNTPEPPGVKNPSTTGSSPPLPTSFTPISPSSTPLYSQVATQNALPLLEKQPHVIFSSTNNTTSRTWRVGSSKFSVFFTVPPKSSPKFDPFWRALLSAYPREVNMGITLGSRSSPDTCELHLPTSADCERACSQPLVVGDSSFPAQPAVPIGTIVRRVFLTKLPRVPYHDLATQLAKCMSPFGKVREIAIHESYGFFDGSGYVVLANTPTDDVPSDSLTYQIAYDDTQKILGKWPSMGSHCTYCKEMGHDVAKCTKRPAETRTCFGCNKTGHLQANCPYITDPSKTSKTSNKRSRHPNRNSKLDRPIIAPKPLIPTELSLIYGGSEASKHNPRQPALHELSKLSPTKTTFTLPTPTETPTSSGPRPRSRSVDTPTRGWDKEIDDRMITNLMDRDEARTLRLQGLPKVGHPESRAFFIRHLRSQGIDILALQETHASSSMLQSTFDQQFRSSSSLWSPHCGVVCLSLHIIFTDPLFSPCGRCITTTITHVDNNFSPFRIGVIYAPASQTPRYRFLASLLSTPDLIPPNPSNFILLGDFNHAIRSHYALGRRAPADWLQFIDTNMTDCITPRGQHPQPTFHRALSSTTIDYILASSDLHPRTTDPQVSYIYQKWSDHCLVAVSLSLPSTKSSGKGLWRANPRLAQSLSFRTDLNTLLSTLVPALRADFSPQAQWDAIKLEVIRFTFCSIHGSRSLSFRGRATIMNSLVLSQLWHALRVVSFPSAFLDRVRSIVRGFFRANSFPPIAFETLCLPRLQGGLGILDPGIQQCALQLRWLKPLIRNPLLPHGLVPQWFSSLLRSDVPTVDPLLPLLFPDCRPRNHRTLDSPLHLVLKAMDTLPRNSDRVVLNLSSCLILPLSSMISSMPSHPPYRPAWRDLRVHHLYQIESNLDILTPITPSRPLPRSVTLNRILNRIRDHTMHFLEVELLPSPQVLCNSSL